MKSHVGDCAICPLGDLGNRVPALCVVLLFLPRGVSEEQKAPTGVADRDAQSVPRIPAVENDRLNV